MEDDTGASGISAARGAPADDTTRHYRSQPSSRLSSVNFDRRKRSAVVSSMPKNDAVSRAWETMPSCVAAMWDMVIRLEAAGENGARTRLKIAKMAAGVCETRSG